MKIKNKIIMTICIIAFAVLGFNTHVKAASAKISASSSEVTVGTKVTITTTINAASWQVSLSGAVSETYAGNTDDAEDKTITKTTSFTPTSSGTYAITLSGNVTGEKDTKATSVSDSIKIVANEAKNEEAKSTNNTTSTKSNNANLKNLGIKPNDFKGFKSGTTSYNVTVPNDVEKVTVYADKSDSKATVTGVGSKNLEVGKNALEVTVTAEDGTKKTYTINVTREEKKAEENTDQDPKANETAENTVADTTTATKNSDLVKMDVAGFNLSPKFSPDVYEYKLKVNQDVNELQINTEGKDKDVSIEVVGNKDLKDGENTITVLVTNKKDNKTSTYQILVEKAAEDNATNYAMQKGLKIRKILIGLVVVFVVFCIVVFIIIKRKSSLRELPKLDYEDDEKDSERINLDEEEEFFKRVNRNKLKRTIKPPDEILEAKEEEPELIETPKALRPKSKLIEEDEENEEEEDVVQYFRTSRPKKGKHF